MLLRPKATIVIFSHLLFFVAICCSNKQMLPKCCPTLNKQFLLKTFFSKSVFHVSKYKKMTLVTGGGLILRAPMYLHHIWESGLSLSGSQKSFLFCWASFFLLLQPIATKNNKCEKMGVVAFGRSNKKFNSFFSLSSCWRAPEFFLA